MTVRLLYLVSHPIQYQAPLLRLIAQEPGISLRAAFQRDTEQGYFDSGFGRRVVWDVPLRQGYDCAVIPDRGLKTEIQACDVVWMHGWQGGRMRKALAWAKRLKKPVLMRGENTLAAMPDGAGLRGVLKRAYLRRIFAKVDRFLTIGSDNHAYYRAHGISEDRLLSMPYAVDNNAFAQAAGSTDLDALRRRMNLEPNRPVILYAGKLMRRKHPHTLIEAWKTAHWAGPRPYLLMAGDGEMKTELAAAADPDVRFLGFQNQSALPALYALADVFVLASEAEPWGLAVNEAMACGTAVIVGVDVGCAADLVNSDNGAKVPPGDIRALALALPHVTEHAQSMGRAASARMANWSFDQDLAGLRAALASLQAGSDPCV